MVNQHICVLPHPCNRGSGTLCLCSRIGGGWRGDQVGINDRALPHLHGPCAEVGFGVLKELFAQLVLLQLVAEGSGWH